MEFSPSDRIKQVPPSFLREIFKLIADSRIISFATGLPNPALFPVEAVRSATEASLREAPGSALQYGTSTGLQELREIIAASYARKDGIDISPEQVLITNGSQQGLELLGKVLINPKDTIVVETPTYLAAIQAFSLYEPTFKGVRLSDDGIDPDALKDTLRETGAKILYTIPNFQNPTGITATDEVRERVARIADEASALIIEDDPYGEIRFEGSRKKAYASLTENAVLLGSFSKIVAPGLRLGWIIVRDPKLYRLLETAKQAADLHTSTFVQHIVYRYYRDSDSDMHVAQIAAAYKAQRDAFCAALDSHFGDTITYTKPEGGMFTWATLPKHIDTAKLFPVALEEGVAFVPGESFFVEAPKTNMMRLNFTNASLEQIEEGMKRLKKAVDRYEKEIDAE